MEVEDSCTAEQVILVRTFIGLLTIFCSKQVVWVYKLGQNKYVSSNQSSRMNMYIYIYVHIYEKDYVTNLSYLIYLVNNNKTTIFWTQRAKRNCSKLKEILELVDWNK